MYYPAGVASCLIVCACVSVQLDCHKLPDLVRMVTVETLRMQIIIYKCCGLSHGNYFFRHI